MRSILLSVTLALLLLPVVSAVEPRTVSKDYTYVPGVTTGCGVVSPNEVCFPVVRGETRVSVEIVDDAGLIVPWALVVAAPGQGAASIGTWCGGMDGLSVQLPAGTTSIRVNFDAQAAAACGSVGTTGTATATFT